MHLVGAHFCSDIKYFHFVIKSEVCNGYLHIRVHSSILQSVFSGAQACPALCDPRECSTPGLPVRPSWNLLQLTSIELGMPSNRLILCCPLLL